MQQDLSPVCFLCYTPNKEKSPERHSYATGTYQTATKNNTGNGTVATLKFKILSGATGTAEIAIKLNQGSTFNVDLEDVKFETVNGSVNITEVSLSSISVKTNPTKNSYFVGDTLDISGLALTATYNNGTTKTITNGFTCTPTTLNTAGSQKITVTYSGHICSFSVEVSERNDEKPGIDVQFSDSENAVLKGENVFAVAGISVADCFSQINGNAKVLKENGEIAKANDLMVTGMLLILPDLSQKTIVVYGDVDKDGKISASDARLTLRGSVNLERYDTDSAQFLAANVNRENALSASDARLILRASVKLEDPKVWLK